MKNYYAHKIMSRNFLSRASYHICVDEAEKLFRNLDCYEEEKGIIILTCLDLLKSGIRGRKKDTNNDKKARELQTEIYEHLINNDLVKYLPVSYFHEVNRYCLRKEEMSTNIISFPIPRGKIEFKATRPAGKGGWVLSATVNHAMEEQTYNHSLYVAKLGLKPPTIKGFPLYNENDNTLWGFEIYLQSPKKMVGCEFNTTNYRFSLFRDLTEDTLAVENLPWINSSTIVKRQGDKLFRFITTYNNEQHQEIESLSHDTRPGLYLVKNDHYIQHPNHRTLFIWSGLWKVDYVPGYNDYNDQNFND